MILGKENGILIKRMKWIEYSKDDLTKNIMREKIIHEHVNKMEVAKVCQENGIPMNFEEEDNKQGWYGNPKDMLQMLWKGGSIDEANCKLYKKLGTTAATGQLDGKYSMTRLMYERVYFLEEKTLILYSIRKIGVVIDKTPKCHPLLAGEDIEYSWVFSNKFYLRFPISKKRGEDTFLGSV